MATEPSLELTAFAANKSHNKLGKFNGFLSANLSTKRGRKIQLIKTLTLAWIPFIILITENIVLSVREFNNLQKRMELHYYVVASVEWGSLIHYLQIERGTTALYISSKGNADILLDVQTKRANTDRMLAGMVYWETNVDPVKSFMVSKESLRDALREYRNSIVIGVTTKDAEICYYTDIINEVIRWISLSIDSLTDETALLQLIAFHTLTYSKENAGLERALGGTFFASGHFDLNNFLWYAEKNKQGSAFLQLSMEYDVSIRSELEQTFFNSVLETQINNMRQLILFNNMTSPSVTLGQIWFSNMTSYIDTLKRVQDHLSTNIIATLSVYLYQENVTMYSILTITIIGVILVPIVTALIVTLMSQVTRFVELVCSSILKVEKEEKKMDFILKQILPTIVVNRLIADEPCPPESYDSVTIFFSDIVGFTTISAKSSSIQVVNMLNLLYTCFDDIIDIYDVYKVETIGDGYLVASGLPEKNGDKHATEIADMALQFLEVVNNFHIPHLPEQKVQLRIGLHTGPCVAAIIGSKMPRYCLFGDTVNTASRMESTGEPMKIQITDETHQMLDKSGLYTIERRGSIQVKGKGKMETFWLVTRKVTASPATSDRSRSMKHTSVNFHSLFLEPKPVESN